MAETKDWEAVVEKATRNHVSYSMAPSYHWGAWTEEDLPSDLKKGATILVRTNVDRSETLGFTWKGVFYKTVQD